MPPRDFNTGAFRGGHTGRDLFTRIAVGLAGTPMVAFDNTVMTDTERWSLVHYVQSLRRKEAEINDLLAPTDALIHASRTRRKLPVDPADPFWESLEAARVALNPLWPEKNPVYAVAVRAVHDGRRLAVLCTWKDRLADGAPVAVQDFQDALALQFYVSDTPPFLGMGDTNTPVNIWHWKADWQREVDKQREDVDTRYPAMHVDAYFEVSYGTAANAGNVLSLPHRSPVEEANADGFGTLRSQPASGQNASPGGDSGVMAPGSPTYPPTATATLPRPRRC